MPARATVLGLCLFASCSLDTSPLGVATAGVNGQPERTWTPESRPSPPDAGTPTDAGSPAPTVVPPMAPVLTARSAAVDASTPPPSTGDAPREPDPPQPMAASEASHPDAGPPDAGPRDAGPRDAGSERDAALPSEPTEPGPAKTRVAEQLVNAVVGVLDKNKSKGSSPDKTTLQDWRRTARDSDRVTAELATDLLRMLSQTGSCSTDDKHCSQVCQLLANDCAACAAADSCRTLLGETCGAAVATHCPAP